MRKVNDEFLEIMNFFRTKNTDVRDYQMKLITEKYKTKVNLKFYLFISGVGKYINKLL